MVRAAVLKGKDPQQILEEMEKIDQMGMATNLYNCWQNIYYIYFLFYNAEYNVNQPSPLNEKVLKDKRKKLRDTLERVLSMYVSFIDYLIDYLVFIWGFCSVLVQRWSWKMGRFEKKAKWVWS